MFINSNNSQDGFSWRPMLVLSVIMHSVLFSMLFWTPGISSGGLKMNEVAYEVNLADPSKLNEIQSKTSAPAVKKPAAKPVSAHKRQARRIAPSSRQKNTVSVSKRTSKRIRSEPRKTESSSSQLLDNAISQIEKKVKTEKDTDYLDRAIAQIDKKAGSSGGGRGVGAGGLAINIYKMEVETKIKSNWTYSGTEDIEAVILVKIRKDGTVLETSFIKPSRNKLFDESVLKAIEKSKPLPPLPEGYKENYEEIKINFNLKDLE